MGVRTIQAVGVVRRIGPDRSRRGFTLVEVLVAMALSAVLLTALMSVASAAAGDRLRLEEQQAEREPGWVEPLARGIEADLQMGLAVSGVVDVYSGGTAVPTVYLVTFHHRGEPDAGHVPALVSYQLVDTGGQGVLIRRQAPMTQNTGATITPHRRQHKAEVLAVGMAEMRLGAATLSLDAGSRVDGTTPDRHHSTMTLLINDQPVRFQPLLEQVAWSITLQPDERPNHDTAPAPTAMFSRTLLTQ